MTGVQTCALPICFPVTIGQFEKVGSMSIDIATMRENGKDMKEDVTHIKDDLDSIKEKISVS